MAKAKFLPDPIYNSLVTKLVNSIMLDGKKGVAQKIVYDAFDIIKEKTGKDPLEVSRRLWRTSCPAWRSRPAVSAAQPIRFPWKSSRPPPDPGSALADRYCPQPR